MRVSAQRHAGRIKHPSRFDAATESGNYRLNFLKPYLENAGFDSREGQALVESSADQSSRAATPTLSPTFRLRVPHRSPALPMVIE
jgi:hypothetical protein